MLKRVTLGFSDEVFFKCLEDIYNELQQFQGNLALLFYYKTLYDLWGVVQKVSLARENFLITNIQKGPLTHKKTDDTEN